MACRIKQAARWTCCRYFGNMQMFCCSQRNATMFNPIVTLLEQPEIPVGLITEGQR